MCDDDNPKSPACPLPINEHGAIQLAHGAGGRLTNDLIRRLFVHCFDNAALDRLDDQATLEIDHLRLSFSTDSFVIDPIFFPGGDIGELAVNGTVNDICMNGARPLYLSAGFIIEEGLPVEDLERIVLSMRDAARRAGVQIVTGDTKVVDRGSADRIFINTTGIGLIEHPHHIAADRIRLDDVLIVSGPIGNHGVAILSQREGLKFETPIRSDTAPLNSLVASILDFGGAHVHAMRDPTRGGVAATLNEWAGASRVGMQLHEAQIPVEAPVAAACELLGLDPLYVANEGKVVVAVEPNAADAVLAAMRGHPLGAQAAVIGKITADPSRRVVLRTRIGGQRIVDMPVGEQLPRIC